MLDPLCVIGHPSRLGGADTELDHQIHCWQALGIVVHICPTGPLDQNLLSMNLAERGCVYHAPRDWRSLAPPTPTHNRPPPPRAAPASLAV